VAGSGCALSPSGETTLSGEAAVSREAEVSGSEALGFSVDIGR
jgi:hypothetical protein